MIWFTNAGDGSPYRWKEPLHIWTEFQSTGKPQLQNGSPCLYRLRGICLQLEGVTASVFPNPGLLVFSLRFCFVLKPSLTAG